MYLKSLQMQGFKSFPDKVEILFGEGITSIVGPNGSGKSNISDAIRWVLGEQSTKTLRGSKMEDVIFGGTQRRSPLGFAEVTLAIDNTARIVKLDCDEVTVSRRYYRSGESEYILNKKAVRLKDVHELFMDTGLGRDGYSIIAQGRIDEVLSQRSEDRRAIFEEAAGITKYRYKKAEAERKLAGAEDNLVRVRDIAAELGAQVGPLEKKAEKAKKFLQIRDELRELELGVWSGRIVALRETSAKAEENARVNRLSLEEARARLEKLYAESETITAEMRRKEMEIEETRAKQHAAEENHAGEKSAQAVLEVSISHREARGEELRADLAGGGERRAALEARLASRREETERLEAKREATAEQLSALRLEAEEKAGLLGDMDERLAGLAALESLEKTRAAESRARIGAIGEAQSAAREQAEARLASRKELEARLASEQKRSEELSAGFASRSEELQAAENVLSGYKLRLDAAEKKSSKAGDELNALKIEQNALSSRRRLLKDLENEYEGYSAAVKSVMQAAKKLGRIHGTVGSLVSVEREFALAIETALGSALQNIIVETEDDAREAINFLKERSIGRATFLPVSAIRGRSMGERAEGEPGFVGIAADLCEYDGKYGEIFSSLLGRVVIAERLNDAIGIARKFGHRFKIVTLDGQVINAGGAMTGGAAGRSSGVLSRAGELAGLEEKLKSYENEIAKKADEAERAGRELAAVRFEIEKAEAEKRTAEDNLLALKSFREQHAVLLESLTRQLSQSEAEGRGEEARLKGLEAERRELEKSAEECDGRAARAAGQFAELSAGRKEETEKSSGFAEGINAAAMRAAALEAEAAASKEAEAELERQVADASASAAELEAGLAREEAETEALRQRREEHAKRISMFFAAAAAHRETVASLASERMELEARRTARDGEVKEQNDRLILLEKEQSRLDAVCENAGAEERQIADRLWESYEMTINEAAAKNIVIPDRREAEKRINELKSARRALGDVDVASIEEYKLVKERFDYLEVQKNDIEKSAKDLEGLIAEITREMEKQFCESFEQIRASFERTFEEIFSGGRAELLLVDEGDVLNCGIEIKAQPPGKNLKVITLLSGGEKALVAIALYFAIIKIRPTPFCVLDEIDAALDDVNVCRFVTYLRSLSEQTQFIVVTHRRGTMERSDILYGVTMQEQGVSRLLTLDLNELDKSIAVD